MPSQWPPPPPPPITVQQRESLDHWVRILRSEVELSLRGLPPQLSPGNGKGEFLRAAVHSVRGLVLAGKERGRGSG
jgi:hypothetical protein